MARSHNEFSVRYIRAEKAVAKRIPRDDPGFQREVLKLLEQEKVNRRFKIPAEKVRLSLP